MVTAKKTVSQKVALTAQLLVGGAVIFLPIKSA